MGVCVSAVPTGRDAVGGVVASAVGVFHDAFFESRWQGPPAFVKHRTWTQPFVRQALRKKYLAREAGREDFFSANPQAPALSSNGLFQKFC